ncbi:hypothetical protein [Rubrivirga marina]|uniref:hypothetical protein n=1 Tax=Rubrivirga marina TaxID=1196024 RepID=UPI0015C8A31B|nr:hypothetical protein [Rubrivirga marina]
MTRRFWIVLLLAALGLGAVVVVSIVNASGGGDPSTTEVDEVTGPADGATPVAR